MLIRSAHSANIKERRDASTALFDADGADGDAGRAHPRAPRRDAGRGGGGARRGSRTRASRGSSTIPFAGRHAPARHHGHHARFRASGASCSASRRAARTTPTSAARVPGSMPADSRTLAEEGVVIAPRPLDERGDRASSSRAMRQPAERRADLRAQLAANRVGALRLAELAARARRRAPARGDRRGARLRRAAHARLPGGAARRRAPSAEDVLEAPDGDLVLRLRAVRRRRAAAARLLRQRAASTTATSTARSR